MSRLEAVQIELEAVQIEKERLEAENKCLREDHAGVAEQIDAEGEVSALQNEVNRLTGIYEQSLEELATMQKSITGETSAVNERNRVEERCKHLEAESAKGRAIAEEKITELQDKLQALTVEWEEQRRYVNGLQAECESLMAQLTEYQKDAELKRLQTIEMERTKWEEERKNGKARQDRLVRQLEDTMSTMRHGDADSRRTRTSGDAIVTRRDIPQNTDGIGTSVSEHTLHMKEGVHTSPGVEGSANELSADSACATVMPAFMGSQLPPFVAVPVKERERALKIG